MRILIMGTYYGFPLGAGKRYGGIEAVTWFLARELVRNRHQVTVVGGKGTELEGAEVINYPSPWQNIIPWIRENKARWDILHDMSHGLEINAALKGDMKVLATLENPNDPKDATNVVVPSKFSVGYTEMYYGRKTKCIYNSVSEDVYPFYPQKRQKYVLQMSVMEHRKGVIEVLKGAKQAGYPVYLAGLKSQSPAYQKMVDSYTDGVNAVWFGEVGGQKKLDLLGSATSTMLYANWSEPGSMCGPESLSVGTPLMANTTGCMQEYVIEGMNGYVVKEESEIADAIHKCAELDPKVVKETWYDSEFRSDVMAKRYMDVYYQVLDGETW